MGFVVAAFYRFVGLGDCSALRGEVLARAQGLGICGTILLATEGINGTIAGSAEAIEGLFEFLRLIPGLAGLSYRASAATQQPFSRMKVKVKREIVTLGQPQADPAKQVGTYVKPGDWNRLVDDPEVLVIDTRNGFEVSVGSFEGAVNPGTLSFSEFPTYVAENLDPQRHQRIAMFCTGGIRCEKASSYLLSQGFDQVYHLEGGILSYLEQVPEAESRWAGECYVFDERVAVGHGLVEGSYSACTSCGHPLSEGDRQSPAYEVNFTCPYCVDKLTEGQRLSFDMRRRQLGA